MVNRLRVTELAPSAVLKHHVQSVAPFEANISVRHCSTFHAILFHTILFHRDDSALRTLSSLRGLRGAPEVPVLWCSAVTPEVPHNFKILRAIIIVKKLYKFLLKIF